MRLILGFPISFINKKVRKATHKIISVTFTLKLAPSYLVVIVLLQHCDNSKPIEAWHDTWHEFDTGPTEPLIPTRIELFWFVCFHCPWCTNNFLQRQMREVKFTFVTLRWAKEGSFNISWCNFASRSYFSDVREFPERGYFLQFSFSVV